jgi:hypothetical protein
MKHTLRYHDFGGSFNKINQLVEPAIIPVIVTEAKIAPAHKGLRPQSPLALSLGLPIQRVLAASRFALSTILARNARAFHYVTGSKEYSGPRPGVFLKSKIGLRLSHFRCDNYRQSRTLKVREPRLPCPNRRFGCASSGGRFPVVQLARFQIIL